MKKSVLLKVCHRMAVIGGWWKLGVPHKDRKTRTAKKDCRFIGPHSTKCIFVCVPVERHFPIHFVLAVIGMGIQIAIKILTEILTLLLLTISYSFIKSSTLQTLNVQPNCIANEKCLGHLSHIKQSRHLGNTVVYLQGLELTAKPLW